MLRIFAALAIVGFVAATPMSVAEESGESTQINEAPKGMLDFDSLSRDFGTVKRGMNLKHRFKFKNYGKGPVTIQGIHSSCGCLVMEIEKGKEYKPQESGFVTIALDTTHYRGPITKTVTLLTNESKRPSRALKLKVNIEEEVTAEPPIVDFGEVSFGELEEKKVVIRAVKMDKPLEIKNLSFDNDHLEVTSIKEGAHYALRIKVKPEFGSGFIKDTILVENNSTNLGKLPILVRGHIVGPIAYAPDYLDFGVVDKDRKAAKSITLKAPVPFAIKSARAELNVNGKPIDAEDLVEVEHADKMSEQKSIKVKLKNAGEPGSVHGRLILETSDSTQKELQMEIYAFFKG